MASERWNERTFAFSRQLGLLFVCAVFVAFAWRLMVRTLESSVNIPFWDQWDFYTPLFNRASLWQAFRWQHGPHREGLGLLADKFLLEWTHWNARAESLLIVGCFSVAAALALYLKARLIAPLTYSDAVIPAMFLMPAHLGAITGVPNPSYSGFPELLILLYSLAWTMRRNLLQYGAVLLLNFALIYTGFGFFIGIITIAVLALELRRVAVNREELLLVSVVLTVALLSLASFFWNYQNAPAKLVRCVEHPQVLNYPWFAALAFALFLGIRRSVVLASLVGGACVLLLAWNAGRSANRLWHDREKGNRELVIFILGGFSLLFIAAAALGRACLGMPGAAQNYRYLGLLVPGFLAAYFQLSMVRSGRARAIAVITFVLAIFPAALHNHADQVSENGKRAWITCLLQGGTVPQCREKIGFNLHPDPARTHLQEKLEYLKRNRLSLYAETASD